jgi:DNA-binding transcriptional regulator of glucitol operon
MKRWQFVLLMTIGVACLCLSLVTIVFARQNRKLQEVVQAQQAIINKGSLGQQIGANLLREMAAVAQTDEKMRQLLQAKGYNLSATPTAAPAP